MTHVLLKKQLILLLCIVSVKPVLGMDKPKVSPKDALVVQPKEPAQTLYNYFGLSNVCASQSLNDLKKRWLQEIIKNQQWWYPCALLGDSTTAAHKVVYSADGTTLATACVDNTVRVWDQKGKNSVAKKYPCAVTGLVCSPKEPFLVVSLENKTMEKVDFSGKTVKIVKDESEPRVIAINQQGTHIGTWPNKGEQGVIPHLKMWPLQGGIPTHFDVKSSHVAFYQEGEDFVVAANNKLEIHQHEGDHGTTTYATDPDVLKITSVAVHPHSTLCATGGDNGTVTLWDKALKKRAVLICECPDAQNARGYPVSLLAFLWQGKRLAAANHKNVLIFDVATGQELSRVRQPGIVKSLAMHPLRKHQLAVACEGSGATIWECYTAVTFEQMLLRLVLKAYIAQCIGEHKEPKCPTEKQQSIDDAGFPTWMAHTFNIQTGSLKAVWRTLPEALRTSIVRTYVHRVQQVKALPAVREQKRREDAERENQRRREQNTFWSYGSFGANW